MTEQEQQKQEYCGYVCSDATEKQQQIIDELMLFSKYNPEYALVMFHKLTDMLTDSKDKFLREKVL